jgi:hypothetical protein
MDADYLRLLARMGGVSPLSLLTFFAAAKKVSPAPDRGNACAPARNREAEKEQKQPPGRCPHATVKNSNGMQLTRPIRIKPALWRFDENSAAQRSRSFDSVG